GGWLCHQGHNEILIVGGALNLDRATLSKVEAKGLREGLIFALRNGVLKIMVGGDSKLNQNFREANFVVDAFARQCLLITSCHLWEHHVPPFALDALRFDFVGNGCIRDFSL
ncbi:hypothetical protein DVH24_015538, partial [Malus domestica]